ncbi:MAG: (Dimethylallyl)adenosine tRNA methylthiotransferase MiaB [candidate division BRC1 bacterium ADurb.BinA364]|nr:MAG: (Dimethylallyl)adenosine tRNA methylthiotransferase MiaB [candidate division BRC1 bacterium ADurb.BinA364]
MLGPRSLSRIAEAAETARGGIRSALLEAAGERRLRLPRRRRNPILEILPINQGCLGHCAYCQTRLARGELLSFPIADIVERARRAIGEGARELWLTSQDTGAYGADIGTSLPRLLEALGELEGGHMFRLGMASPHWLKRDMAPLLDALDNPRFYRFIHAPVQSGDDRVLRAMRRPYAVRDFEWAVDAIRSRFPRAAIWTDIIAGFPTETGEEFERTLDLLRRVRPATVNRSRFSPRPGTEAAAMPQLPSGAISERSRRLARLVEDISRESLKEWIGWAGEARIVETKKPGTAMARNFAYRPIALRGDYEPGRIVRVRASGQTTYHLTGSEIKET